MILSFVLSVQLFFRKKRNPYLALSLGALLWGGTVFFVTELLSLIHQLRAASLFLFYGGYIALLAFLLFGRKEERAKLTEEAGCLRERISNNRMEALLLGIFSVFMIVLAIRSVPHNIDSMTYHLSRVVHWAGNRSIAHYATHIIRQISTPVLSEIFVLHGYILAGRRDYFVNLPQCFAFLMNGLMLRGICLELGSDRKWGRLSMLLFFTAPIAFSEGITTQTDQIAAFWAVVFVYLCIRLMKTKMPFTMNAENAVLLSAMGFAAGLGYNTKPNSDIPMAFFALALLCYCLRSGTKIREAFKAFLAGGIPAVLLVAPEYLRNRLTFHAGSSPVVGKRQLVEYKGITYSFVNFLKNFTFNIPTLWWPGSTEKVEHIVTSAAETLGVDINDPAIAEDGRAFFAPSEKAFGADMGTAPLIFWLFVISLILLIIGWKKYSRIQKIYYGCTAASFLLFLAILRWEPFVARYMIVFFALLCPAVLLFPGAMKKKASGYIFTLLAVILCLPAGLGAASVNTREAFASHRNSGYFIDTETCEKYTFIADYFKDNGLKDIGLVFNENDLEYPLMRLLDNSFHLEHVLVENESSAYEDREHAPDAILITDAESGPEPMLECHGEVYLYDEASAYENMAVYVKK